MQMERSDGKNAAAGQTPKMNGTSVTVMRNGVFLSMMMGSCFHSHIDANGLFILLWQRLSRNRALNRMEILTYSGDGL